MKPNPAKVAGMKHGSYDKLNEKGYVPEETTIVDGDIIIGKVSPIQPTGNSNKVFKDSSVVYKSYTSGVIDKVYTNIFNAEGYEMRKVRIRSERVPRIGDKFCCYSDDTEILTDKGWLLFKDLSIENHNVATLVNGDTLQYTKPIEIMSYDFDDNMHLIDTNQVNLLVTPNHRMWVADREGKRFKIETAEEIYGKRRKFQKNIDHYLPNLSCKPEELSYYNQKLKSELYQPQSFKLKSVNDNTYRLLPIEDWLTFFGIWIAEGCTLRDWGVSIATHKERVKSVLDKVIPSLGFEIKKHKDKVDDEIRNAWCISDKDLVNYIKPLSVGAVNKSLPNWVWSLTKNQCRILIDGMMLGDGHTMENGTRRYDTSSTKLANDFQRLCLHAGYSTNIAVKYEAGHVSVCKAKGREGEIFKSAATAYRMTIIESQNTPLINKNIKLTGENRQDSKVPYKGKVYCCRVMGDGVIYVRRNNIPVWCGNSRHGQKGTIGLYLRQSDMPFTKHGMTPDIILNPHCIPSRMTLGQIIECVMGKSCAIKGIEGDGTPFNGIDIDSIREELEKLGYSNSGKEYLYNGMTGQKLKTEIFIGPTYYLRLKHLVEDKFHSRARGPKTLLMHQPPEGRSRDGGLRLGEMERDTLLAHGISKFLKEKLLDTSDAYSTYVCDICGLFAQRLKKKDNASHSSSNDLHFCQACKNYTKISKVMIPYAFKLVLQEMMAMNIAPRIRVEQDKIM